MALFYTDEYDEKTCKRYNKQLKFLYSLVIVTALIVVYSFSILAVSLLNHKDFCKEEFTSAEYNYYFSYLVEDSKSFNKEKSLSREDAEKYIRDEININAYILIRRKPIMPLTLGITFLVPRIIMVDDTQEDNVYLTTLAHEFIHLKYMTGNELFTQYMAFKILYESNNEYLHYLGCSLAIRTFNLFYGADEYYCVGNIISYLKSKEV